jgi:amino acid transporter
MNYKLITSILIIIIIIIIFLLIFFYKNDSFANTIPKTTNQFSFLRTNITQSKINPQQEQLFTIPANVSPYCQYPEQCRHPIRKLYGS